MQTTNEIIPVVTSFICCDGKIAVLKRSNQVGSYKGMWAGFSGYIEKLPIEQAFTELDEEAGLKKDMLSLKSIGIPVVINDISIDKQWLVFPFLFEINDKNLVKLNRESSEIQWVSPGDIKSMNTVPGLYNALMRVWPVRGTDEFWYGLSKIAEDKTHGATFLARKGLEILGKYVVSNEADIDRIKLISAIRAYAAVRPSMGVFPDLAARLLLGVEHDDGRDDFDLLVETLIASVNESTQMSIGNILPLLHGKKKIFTLSNSEATKKSLIGWYKQGDEVIIAESYPGNEGIILADQLAEFDVNVRTIKDKYIDMAIMESDAVLVGCDAITSNDNIQNKVGTKIAAKAANRYGIPLYAITQTFKIAPPDWPAYIECETDSVSGQVHSVFDHTPIDWFDEIITENGSLTCEILNQIRGELSSVELIPVD